MLGRDQQGIALLDCCVSRAFCPLRSVHIKTEDTGEANTPSVCVPQLCFDYSYHSIIRAFWVI